MVKNRQHLNIDRLKIPSTSSKKKRQRGHTIKTSLSGHIERKAVILLAIWDEYLTVDEVARKTFSESLGIDFEHHKQNTKKSLNKYLHFFEKPYLISKFYKKNKGRISYKCSWKGKRMACELHFRQERWIDLNWKHSRLIHRGGNGYKKNTKYNVICSKHCMICRYYPFNKPKPAPEQIT